MNNHVDLVFTYCKEVKPNGSVGNDRTGTSFIDLESLRKTAEEQHKGYFVLADQEIEIVSLGNGTIVVLIPMRKDED